jgi:hypothetical protein
MQIWLMKTGFLFVVLFFNVFFLQAQRVHVGVAGGLANYNGDLLDKLYAKKLTNGFIGFTAHYELEDQILIRAAFNFARVDGSDAYSNKENLRLRNLRFESAISEFSVVGEYYLFNLYEKRFSPYGFIGLGVFHFDPYTNDSTGRKVFLQPLSTEGQGLSQYPKQKPYKLTQLALGFGGGARYAINDNMNIGVEFSQRKTFTDYLDDVSSIYVDENILLQAKGPKAVEMAFRGDELPGGQIYPGHGAQRGTPSEMDWYYFFGINFEIKFSAFTQIFKSWKVENSSAIHNTRCPRNIQQ